MAVHSLPPLQLTGSFGPFMRGQRRAMQAVKGFESRVTVDKPKPKSRKKKNRRSKGDVASLEQTVATANNI